MQELFGDGAAAVVVGAGACEGDERPLFEMVSASQTVIPNSEDAAAGYLGEGGLAFWPSPKMPDLVRQHVERVREHVGRVDNLRPRRAPASPGRAGCWVWGDACLGPGITVETMVNEEQRSYREKKGDVAGTVFVPSTNWFHSSARPPSSPGCLGLAVASQNPLLGDYWTEHSTSCVLHWQAKRSAVLAIGTANPANCVQYVDWYFRVTKSDHLTGL
ncbi:hypothetical protein EJB05_27088, partial [Eragrostis curvula]